MIILRDESESEIDVMRGGVEGRGKERKRKGQVNGL